MRAATAALAIAMLALLASAPAAQALPAKFWGVVPQAAPTAEQFQRLKRGGVATMRIPVFWGSVQPVPGGAFDWSQVDQLVGGATAVGIEVLPFLYGAPTWAVPADRIIPSHPPKYLPVRTGLQRAGWTRFLGEVIGRYGPNGSFWAQNPGLPKRPIRVWQLWNEQNFKYFVARPNPAEYGKLVSISYPAIKAADPTARIVLGGMFSAPKEALIKRGPPQAFFASDFLEQMYRLTPGVKRKFHGVAVHPYTEAFQRIGGYVEEIRDVLAANRDTGKGLWLTELSWSSQRSSAGNFAKGRQGQAKQLRGAFGLLRANQRKWNVQRVYWFSVDDQEGSCNFCDGSGLFGPGFVPKPSWFAFTAFSGGKP
ncbi:MAG TPA: glycosyl hydrolase [Solirubrobacterales bacterium]|nr:glycosyl hydrolase [Solirubrobacterales bacterium]